MGERTIDVEKCEQLAYSLHEKLMKDPEFMFLPNYELEAVLVFAVSYNAFVGGRTEGGSQ